MSDVRPDLSRLHRALWRPACIASSGLVLFYWLFLMLVPDIPRSLRMFHVLSAVIVFSAMLLVEYAMLVAHLRVFQGLNTTEKQPTSRHWLAAAREAQALPGRAAWLHFWLWAASGVALSLAAVLWGGASGTFALGSLLTTWLMAPMGALVVDLVALQPSRRAFIRLLDAGRVPAEARLRLLPAHRRNLRRRLMFFTGVCAVTPTVLMAKLVLSRTLVALDALVPSGSSPGAPLELVTGEWLVHVLFVAAAAPSVALFISVLAARSLREPLQRLSGELQRLGQGDLRQQRVIVGEDEVAAASLAVGSIELQLASALRQMRDAGAGITQVTEELVRVSSQHETGAAQQVASLVNTVATTEELARSAAQIAEAASSVAGLAQNTLNSAQSGRLASETFVQAMERTKAENQAIADSVVRLNKRVQQIGKIIEFINGVADKSDLLALNAELEGTKAGEVGRGFSLVAAEMRRLAETVLDSTREISKLIEEIRDATHAAVMATEAGVKATDQGAQLANQVSSRLFNIVKIADQTSDAVRAISLSTQQQQTGTNQLVEAMNAVLQGTDAEARATRDATQANADLFELSRDLGKAVEQFQLKVEEQR